MPRPTSTDPAVTEFAIILTRALKKRGLRGDWVLARIEDQSLTLTGAESGAVSIAWERIERVRVGFVEVKGGSLYECKLWVGPGERLTLGRHNACPACYRDGVLALADRVVKHRGSKRSSADHDVRRAARPGTAARAATWRALCRGGGSGERALVGTVDRAGHSRPDLRADRLARGQATPSPPRRRPEQPCRAAPANVTTPPLKRPDSPRSAHCPG